MLEGLLPGSVSIAESEIASAKGEVYPEEAWAIRSAVENRRREFQVGRALARTALSALGYPAISLPVRHDRTPAWPQGAAGSITHSDHYCTAAVAPSSEVAAIGIDIEEIVRFDPAFVRLICSAAEQEALETAPSDERQILGALAFSAKESFFKCQYNVTKAWLGFTAIEVQLEPSAGEFTIVPRAAEAMRVQSFRGRYRTLSGIVCTALILPALELQ